MADGVIVLEVSGPVRDSPRGDAEAATALLRELHLRTVLRVSQPTAGPARAAGGKGDPVGSWAELAVTGLFSATTVAAFARIAVAFLQRGAARRITLRDGDRTMTITAPTDDTERAVAAWLNEPRTAGGASLGAG
jgi:hypothetical protein